MIVNDLHPTPSLAHLNHENYYKIYRQMFLF